MLLAATAIFLYYTTWTLLMVGLFVLEFPTITY